MSEEFDNKKVRIELEKLNESIRTILKNNLKILQGLPKVAEIFECSLNNLNTIKNLHNFFNSSTFLEVQETLEDYKRISGLSQEEYDEHFKNKIAHHEIIGNHGWVLGLQLGFDDEQQIYNKIHKGVDEKELVCFFFQNKEDILNYFDAISQKYNEAQNLKLFIDKSLLCYKSNDFSSAAFYICAVFERRLQEFLPNYDSTTERARDGIKKSRKGYFNQLKTNNKTQGFTEIYYLLYFLPSFKTFCKRLFVDGKKHKFNGGTEPKYFNRNWFVHGKMTRDVEEYEVLQLLNALTALEDAIEYFSNKREPK